MKGWELKRIDELGNIITGKTPSSYHPDEFGIDFPFITPSDIPSTQRMILTERFVSDKGKEKLKRIVLPEKSVCVVCIGATIGKTCMTNAVSISNQQINSIVPNKKNDNNFVYYIATTLKDALISFAGGSATPIINKSTFSSIKIKVPPLLIQRKIAAILSAYDDLIENNNRRIAILEKMAEELYREWFVRLRFPGHEKTKIIKGVPEGWEVKKIGDVVNATMGQSPSSEFYNQEGNGLPFNQGVGTYGKRFPKKEVFCNSSGRIAEKNDILISVRAPVGRLNIADCKMIIGRGLAALRHKQYKSSYLYYLLNNIFSSEDIIGNGAIFNSVTKDELLGFKIISPQNLLINIFDEKAKYIDDTISIIIRKNQFLTTTRDRLLTRLMSGKIDVENLDIEFPASMKEEVPDA
jgi:type I restriction enzyme S subunit